MKTKKILAIAMCIILVASIFTACGKHKEEEVTNTTTTTTTTEKTEEVTVPSIDNETTSENTTTEKATETTKQNGTTTTKKANVVTTNNSKPTTTKKVVTTTKKPESTTKKPVSTTASNTRPAQTAYFTASTGEKIKYYTYRSLDGSTCTGISESNGRIVATYDHGGSETWTKCPDCGKYLCDGNCVDHSKCPYCGWSVEKCHRYV